ncbi:MAG TPA: ABC transporter ATP-binding protein [Thermoanaerobaculia bacterium]|jgi:putative ABC transport system ATP-binding protein|nr:ABC transporter ATP-binding protein [Thermoanaerobaculia bacterium]
MPKATPFATAAATSSIATAPRIELVRLTRRLPSGERELTIVDAVDLSIPAGQFVAVLGPSGSGKSTLLALMAGLDRPTAGEVLIDGQPISNLSEDELALLRRHKIGFVFQSFQLLGNLTARENVLLPAELRGLPDPAARADELLAAVGLGDRGHHYPSQLSGGEQQRVALARAFAARPPILLADEPTGNLDGATGRVVLDLMSELHRREGTTLVLVTHDPAVAALADRQIHLRDGRIERLTPERATPERPTLERAGEAPPAGRETAAAAAPHAAPPAPAVVAR